MGKREISGSGIVLIVLITVAAVYGGMWAVNEGYLVIPGAVTEPTVVIDVEGDLAYMKTWLVAEDNPSDDLESEDVYLWYDWNGDGVMQRSTFEGIVDGALIGGEIETTTSGATDGYFQTRVQYPVGKPINVMVDPGADGGYQITYQTITMYGSADTSNVITTADIVCRATDDAITFSGLIRGTSIDDGTDYNATLNGKTGVFEIRAALATSDAGFNSQTEGNPTYLGEGKFTHWGSGKDYAATFVGGYGTNQDIIDLGLDSGDFDFYYQGASNTYFAKFVDDFDAQANTFYDSDDDSSPTFTFSCGVDITATGALTYVGLFQNVEWAEFNRGIWGPTTDATILGTCGAGWDWTVV
jgi:hypothetical protein